MCVCVSVQVVDEWSAGGFKVLAIAQADIANIGTLSLPGMSQQQVEDCAGSLDLVGLVILSNHVNPDSKATVKELQERWAAGLLLALWLQSSVDSCSVMT